MCICIIISDKEAEGLLLRNRYNEKPLASNTLAVGCHLSYSDMISGVIKDNEVEHRH